MRDYKKEYKRQKENYTCIKAYIDVELGFKLKEKLKRRKRTIAGWISENAENYIKYE